MHMTFLLAASSILSPLGEAPVPQERVLDPTTSQASQPIVPAAPAEEGLADIVVTAQRRSQNIQDVPIAITAVSGDALTKAGIRDPRDLTLLEPSLSLQAGTSASTTALFIRGVGIGDFNSNTTGAVGVYVDDVFMGANAGKLFNIFDGDGVEVLKGPQGTLYGRNTTAGAIRFTSRKPSDDLRIDASALYGRFNEVNLEAGIGGPLIADLLKVRFAGTTTRRDGWLYNRITGNKLNDVKTWAARAIVDLTPAEGLLLRGTVHVGRNRGGARQFAFLGQGVTFSGAPSFVNGVPANGFGYADTDDDLNRGDYDVEGKERIDVLGASLMAEWRLDAATLTSITAYEQVNRHTLEDSDASPSNVLTATYIDRPRQFSQELRLASVGGGPFNWIFGGFYFHDDLTTRSSYDVLRLVRSPSQPLGGFDPEAQIANAYFPYTQKTKSTALFGQADYRIASGLTATLGLRASRDRIGLDYLSVFAEPAPVGFFPRVAFNGEKTFRDLSYRAALNYKFSDSMIYAAYSKGYNSGGFAGGAASSADQLLPYKSERLYSYEAGVKSELFNHRIRLNTSAFYYKYDDLQVFVFDTSRLVPVQRKLNAGSADLYGLEVSLNAQPTKQLNVSGGLTYLHTEFTRFVALADADYRGNRLINAPTLSATAGFAFTQPVNDWWNVRLSAEAQYRSSIFLTPDNASLGRVPAYALVNARAAWVSSDDRYEFAVWAKNITGKRYVNFISPIITSYELNYNDPATFGLQLVYHSR